MFRSLYFYNPHLLVDEDFALNLSAFLSPSLSTDEDILHLHNTYTLNAKHFLKSNVYHGT